MVWRVLGVAVVLLAVGVAGGYAVADRTTEQPTVGGTPSPLAAVSPAAPTPPVVDVLPDPDFPALATDVPLEPKVLRTSRKNGDALAVDIPEGWIVNRSQGAATWNYVATNLHNTYTLRIGIVAGQHVAVSVALGSRIEALKSAQSENHLSNLEITAQSAEAFQATYVDEGFLRVTTERWVSFHDGTAYATVAAVGRTIDKPGLDALVTRVAMSMEEAD
jgi:hypothetical protein